MTPQTVLIAAALATVLCAGPAYAQELPRPAPTLAPVTGTPAAPDFELPDTDGKLRRLSQSRGKVVMVNFWATWCPPCRREMPSMQRAWDNLKGDDFTMYAVDVGEDEDTVFAFTLATGVELKFPILLDKSGAAVKQWPVRGLPTTFILDREGRVVYRAIGGREWDDPSLLHEIRALMRAP